MISNPMISNPWERRRVSMTSTDQAVPISPATPPAGQAPLTALTVALEKIWKLESTIAKANVISNTKNNQMGIDWLKVLRNTGYLESGNVVVNDTEGPVINLSINNKM